MKTPVIVFPLATLVLLGSLQSATAALIAADSFLVGGTGNYTAGNLSAQTSTGGTTGYAGTAWVYSTGAVQVQAANALSHPLTTGSPSANQGGVSLPGVGASGTRSQIRQLAAYDTAASDYYLSGLMSSSVSFTTGTALFGLSAVSGSATLPTTGLQVGFTGGGNIAVFYRNSGGTYTNTTLLSNYSAGSTYMFVVHLSSVTGLVDVSVYSQSGALAASVLGIQTQTAVATDLTRVDASVTGDFNAGSPSIVRFDELRYGTTLADVLIPEPSALALVAGSALAFGIRRRRQGLPPMMSR